MTPEELGLPSVVSKLALLPEGLIIISGPSGSGRSTTLAAIINEANRTRNDHIITIEEPVEFVHENAGCIIDQCEVGTHTDSSTAALRNASYQDADIILVDKMKDIETISSVLGAASNGYLVLTCMDAVGAIQTIERLIEIFPVDRQFQIRNSLSFSIKAVLSQVLFKRIDVEKQCAAFEVLIANTAVRHRISDSKTHMIESIIQTGKRYGMQLLTDAIIDLLKKKWISSDDAYSWVKDTKSFMGIKMPSPIEDAKIEDEKG